VFRSEQVRSAREALQRNIERGWQDTIPRSIWAGMAPWSEYRGWAKWLVVHSRWAIEGQRDMPAALEDWRMIFGLHRQMLRMQTAIAHLVAMATDSLAAKEMILAAQAELPPMDTRAFAEYVWMQTRPSETPSQWLEGERIYMQATLEDCYVRQDGDWIDVSAVVTHAYARPGGGS